MNTHTTTTFRRVRLAAGALGVAAMLAACSSGAPAATVAPTPVSTSTSGSPATAGPTSSPTPAGTPSAMPSPGGTPAVLESISLSAGDGAAAALAAVGTGRVTSIDLEREHGTVVWRVDVLTTDAIREVDVDAVSGAVLADRPDTDGDDVREEGRLLDASSIDHARALQLAVAEVADGRVVDLDLDDDDDAPVWDVDVLAPGPVQRELTIDAASGAILKNERG